MSGTRSNTFVIGCRSTNTSLSKELSEADQDERELSHSQAKTRTDLNSLATKLPGGGGQPSKSCGVRNPSPTVADVQRPLPLLIPATPNIEVLRVLRGGQPEVRTRARSRGHYHTFHRVTRSANTHPNGACRPSPLDACSRRLRREGRYECCRLICLQT